MSTWQHDGSRVFNGTAPTADWATLDLRSVAGGGSTTHPTARTLAVLKVLPSAAISYTGFRPDGTSYQTRIGYSDGHGCCSIATPASRASIVVVPTSAAGVVEWRSFTAGVVEIWLLGYVEAEIADDIVRADSAMPSAWTTLDLTEDTGASPTGLIGEALAFVWCERTGGTINDCATRPVTPGGAYLVSAATDGASQGRPHAVNDYEGYLQKTNNSGEIEIIAGATVPNTILTLASYEESGWTDLNTVVFATAAPPTSWADLDLSGSVGSKRSLVLLELSMDSANPGTPLRVGFRPNGDTSDYMPSSVTVPMGAAGCALDADEVTALVVETDASGVVEWQAHSAVTRDCSIRLLGALIADDPPVISSALPTGTVVPETSISFSTADDSDQPSATIDLEVAFPGDPSATDIIINGVFQSPYTGTIVANGSNGYDVSVNAIPMPEGTYTATAYCEDDIGQSDTEVWGWTVASTQDPPALSGQEPASILRRSDEVIRCTVTDHYGIDLSTLVITAIPCIGTPLVAYTGSAWQSGWGGAISGTGGSYGSPTRVQISITTLHEDFLASAPKRWAIDVTADTIVGETL